MKKEAISITDYGYNQFFYKKYIMSQQSLTETINDLEKIFAEVQYAAIISPPFNEEEADTHLKMFSSISQKLDDLCHFIKFQTVQTNNLSARPK